MERPASNMIARLSTTLLVGASLGLPIACSSAEQADATEGAEGEASQAAVTAGPITSGFSGKCLGDAGGRTTNGNTIDIYSCNGTAGQKFAAPGGGSTGGGGTSSGNATQINGPGGQCVDVAGDNTGGNGTAVQLWACQGAPATDQQWAWNGSTLRTLGRCLDITGGGTANLTKLELWDCNGGAGQNWQQVGNTLVNPASGRCVDSPGGATANGTQLEIYDCNGTGAQYFVKAA